MNDIVFISFGILVSIALAFIDIDYSLYAIIPFLMFFLFCNVFRIRRNSEFIWAFVFLLSVGIGQIFEINIIYVAPFQLLLGIIFIITEMRLPSYHGIYWKNINPDLEKWWIQKMANK